MKTIAVIPCHDEEKHIAEVVKKSLQHVDQVLVEDDASTDATSRLARGAGAFVVNIKTNHGAGYAVVRGLKLAKIALDADIIVILDGDGQHNPDEIPKLIVSIAEDSADIVMGQRFEGNMPPYRRFGNNVLSFVCNIGATFKPPDAMSGYWAISTKAIPELTENKWGWAVELLIKSRNNGSRMMGVPVEAIYHDKYSDNSAVSPLRLGLSLLWMIIKWRFKVEVFKR